MVLSDTNKLFLYSNLTLNQQMVLRGEFKYEAKMYFRRWNLEALKMYKEIMKIADQQTQNGADYIENLTCEFSEIADLILATDTDSWLKIKNYVKKLTK